MELIGWPKESIVVSFVFSTQREKGRGETQSRLTLITQRRKWNVRGAITKIASHCFVNFVTTLCSLWLIFRCFKPQSARRKRAAQRTQRKTPSFWGMEVIGWPKESIVVSSMFSTQRERGTENLHVRWHSRCLSTQRKWGKEKHRVVWHWLHRTEEWNACGAITKIASYCFVNFVTILCSLWLIFRCFKPQNARRKRAAQRIQRKTPSFRGMELIGWPKESIVVSSMFSTQRERGDGHREKALFWGTKNLHVRWHPRCLSTQRKQTARNTELFDPDYTDVKMKRLRRKRTVFAQLSLPVRSPRRQHCLISQIYYLSVTCMKNLNVPKAIVLFPNRY